MCERFDATTGFERSIQLSARDTRQLKNDDSFSTRWLEPREYVWQKKVDSFDRCSFFNRQRVLGDGRMERRAAGAAGPPKDRERSMATPHLRLSQLCVLLAPRRLSVLADQVPRRRSRNWQQDLPAKLGGPIKIPQPCRCFRPPPVQPPRDWAVEPGHRKLRGRLLMLAVALPGQSQPGGQANIIGVKLTIGSQQHAFQRGLLSDLLVRRQDGLRFLAI